MSAQLSFFRQRRGERHSPLEFQMQCVVADTLKKFARPDWRWTHFPAGEARPTSAGGRLQRMGLQPGWPDLILISPTGQVHFIELKRRGGKPTELQAAFALWCHCAKVPHAFCDSVRDAIEQLNTWGVYRCRVEPW